MKKLLTILMLFCMSASFAIGPSTYYVSASGNDNNPGSSGLPWRTLSKVNTVTFISGDSIFFNRGDVFTGSLVIKSSNFYIGAYGTGAKPVISGFTTLTTWTNVGTNLWECTPAVSLKANCNVLTINGVPYAVGRTPNSGYLTYQSATQTQLTSTTMPTGVTGAEVVVKKNSYTAEKSRITAQSGNTITYTSTNPIDNNQALAPVTGTPNFGYFIQRNASTLDQFGEWYFNFSTNKFRIYSITGPAAYTVKASYVDTLVSIQGFGKANITIDNLAFEGAGMYAVESDRNTNLTVKNCSFNNNTRGVYAWNTLNAVVDNNALDNSFCNAIVVVNRQNKQITVSNNTVTNTGQLIGMGLFASDINLKGIYTQTDTSTAGNFTNILNNRVINSGHAGIQFQGSNVTVARNFVDTFCNQLQDNGGIYTFVSNGPVNTMNYVNRSIIDNFILNSAGAPSGSNGEVDVAGGYMDDRTMNIKATGNTIAYVAGPGAQFNNTVNVQFTDNTLYSDSFGINVNKKPYSDPSGLIIKRNKIYQNRGTQYNFLHVNTNLLLPTPKTIVQSMSNLGIVDSNYISNLKPNGYKHYYNTGVKDTFPPDFPLSTFQITYGHDVHSALPPVTLTATNSKLYCNASDTVAHISFAGFRKQDPNGNVYDNSINIPRWSSVILIDNGNSPAGNTPPSAVIAPVANITLPVSQVTLTSNSTDPDGTISSYQWLFKSGGTYNIVSPTLISTVINNLAAGTYQFQLVVTDNSGATDTAAVIFVVNPAIVPPNVPPTVSALPVDTTITLPANSVTFVATATDPDGTISSHFWSKLLGPATYTIVSPGSATTVINNLVQGSYTFQDSVTDNGGATAKVTVQVTVNAAPPNTIPVPKAGEDKLVTLPQSSATLIGSAMATTPGATITGYAWAITAGPGIATLGSATSATTTIDHLIEGQYTIQLTVTDSNGLTATDEVKVTVNPEPARGGPYILRRTRFNVP